MMLRVSEMNDLKKFLLKIDIYKIKKLGSSIKLVYTK